jgi:hypothetical protein
MTDEPLIYTTKGNIPMAGLTHDVSWRVSDTVIVCVERYYLGDEMVKESSHVHVLVGATAIGDASI